MVQNYYKYLDKLKKLDEENPYTLPLLGVITEFFTEREFDFFDLNLLMCTFLEERFNKKILLKSINDLLQNELLSVANASREDPFRDEYTTRYSPTITYSEFRLIRFRLYNK